MSLKDGEYWTMLENNECFHPDCDGQEFSERCQLCWQMNKPLRDRHKTRANCVKTCRKPKEE